MRICSTDMEHGLLPQQTQFTGGSLIPRLGKIDTLSSTRHCGWSKYRRTAVLVRPLDGVFTGTCLTQLGAGPAPVRYAAVLARGGPHMRSGPVPQYAFQDEHPGLGLAEIPPWPATLIEPTKSELVRWFQLWSHPQATVWARTGREHAVATVVRLEVRCNQKRSSPLAYAELVRLRTELGLNV